MSVRDPAPRRVLPPRGGARCAAAASRGGRPRPTRGLTRQPPSGAPRRGMGDATRGRHAWRLTSHCGPQRPRPPAVPRFHLHPTPFYTRAARFLVFNFALSSLAGINAVATGLTARPVPARSEPTRLTPRSSSTSSASQTAAPQPPPLSPPQLWAQSPWLAGPATADGTHAAGQSTRRGRVRRLRAHAARATYGRGPRQTVGRRVWFCGLYSQTAYAQRSAGGCRVGQTRR